MYARQNKGEKLNDLSEAVIAECAQLAKANSIAGCKQDTVVVVYTKWRNLKKTSAMAPGTVGFHDVSKVRRVTISKDKSIVNALNRTKREATEGEQDLAAAQQARAQGEF